MTSVVTGPNPAENENHWQGVDTHWPRDQGTTGKAWTRTGLETTLPVDECWGHGVDSQAGPPQGRPTPKLAGD